MGRNMGDVGDKSGICVWLTGYWRFDGDVEASSEKNASSKSSISSSKVRFLRPMEPVAEVDDIDAIVD